MDIASIRTDYKRASLDKTDVLTDPVAQFQHWLDEAIKAQVPEPTAMTLATITAEGRPAARIVLLKEVDPSGFVFYTNYESRKGRELAANGAACLVFYWAELERQVRIDGTVDKTSAAEADLYFAIRPPLSRIGAWASPQSQVIENRSWLEARFAEAELRFKDKVIPRPTHWGGYRLAPHTLEFWQGRPNRLHDRLQYRRQADGPWILERLAP